MKLACNVLQGRHKLHYCRPLGGIRPLAAFTDSTTGSVVPLLEEYPVLSDAQIEEAAWELGLVRTAVPSRKRQRAAALELPPLDADEGITQTSVEGKHLT